MVFILVVFLSQVFFISFSHNLYCSVLFQCIMLCYCYGGVSNHFGPSAFNKFGFGFKVYNCRRFRRLVAGVEEALSVNVNEKFI